jgi:hypothetical protein
VTEGSHILRTITLSGTPTDARARFTISFRSAFEVWISDAGEIQQVGDDLVEASYVFVQRLEGIIYCLRGIAFRDIFKR